MNSNPKRNALAGETSPYLLQHADNPVDWYPWGEEARRLARETGKPILLSVGYSACHWCHVMAHESFEDEETARVMNQHFVNVKVDREERPDIDKIYQLSHQLLTQRAGGWPLTMFLTPDDLTPFFGGTYFPPAPRFGMPAFKELLLRVIDFLAEHRDDVKQQNAALREALARADPSGSSGEVALGEQPLAAARQQLESVFDREHGGFGGAPKFPHPTNLERLLRGYAASHEAGQPDQRGLHIAVHTLERMALGGIYDHLGGGFCRYSVDGEWMIPHFEKMLYDNGPLLALYAEAWQLTGEPRFERVARETGAWVQREMQSPEGGYYSTLDADSEGEEGKFYVWSREEIAALLDPDELAVLSRVYGVDRAPNFESKHWHLHTFMLLEAVASDLGLDPETAGRRLDRARGKLFEARAPRIRPARDEKILTAWNAMMIRGMASAGRILDEPELVASAERAFAFVQRTMWSDGRLLATYKDGRAHLSAYLDDYAFLLDATLEMLSLRWREEDLALACALAEVLLTRFQDPEHGGFFFTADDHEQLIHRSKGFMDDALPAGNGVASLALTRLGHLIGEPRYLDAAQRAVKAAWESIARYPHGHNAMLNALEAQIRPPQTIVLRGEPEALARWQQRALDGYAPRRASLAIPSDAAPVGLLGQRVPRGPVTAYLCEGMHCEAPLTDFDAFDRALAAHEVPRGGAPRTDRA